MGFNIGEIGVKNTINVTRDICAHHGQHQLRTKGTVSINYSVQNRDAQFNTDMTKITVHQPFSVNFFLTKNALEEGYFFKSLAFFVSPQIYKLTLVADMFHNAVSRERIPFEIDGERFDAKLYCGSDIPAVWKISLYKADMELLGEMNGEISSQITFKTVPPAGHFFLSPIS
jgi:hypothetical protein